MSAKIGYRVIYASSSDTGHSASELEIRNAFDETSPDQPKSKNKGKGWQSSRFCEFPQELVVALNEVCDVTQIQLLSHQSKIASKVEIWVGLDQANTLKHDENTYQAIAWKRLGYLSLDKNERSNWKARELKSVYINAVANYVRFSLQEPHINSINLFSQVGVVALSVLGKVNEAYARSTDRDEILSSNGGTQQQQQQQQHDTQSHSQQHMNLKMDPEIDAQTAKKIRELLVLKKQAVEREDYDEAKRCKIGIDNLRQSAKQLFTLEKQKKIAVQQEDYDMAKTLKLQIDRLRNMSLTGHRASTQQSQPVLQPPSYNAAYPPPPPQAHQMYAAHGSPHASQQQQQPQPQPQVPYASLTQQPPPPQSVQAIQGMSPHSASMSVSPQHGLVHSARAFNPDERQIRPMKKNFHAIDVNAVQNPFGNNAENANPNMQQQQQQHPSMSVSQQQKAVANDVRVMAAATTEATAAVSPLAGAGAGTEIATAADGTAPPPLKASVKKGAEKMIEVFGEYTVCLLYSPNWNHRDEGLKNVATFVTKKEHPDLREVFKLSAKLIYHALQDRVPSIILTAIDVLNVLMNVYGGGGGKDTGMDANDMCKSLQALVIILVNLLGHSNNRLIDGAGSILISLCHCDEVLRKCIYSVLIKKMKKLLPKHLKGRGLIVLQLLPQFQIPKGVELTTMMDNLIKPQLTNKNGEIRDIGIQTTTFLFQLSAHRQSVVQYLEHSDLNDFIKETLNDSFKHTTGQQNVLERDPKSIKEQSRPSKAMNRGRGGMEKPKRHQRNKTGARKTMAKKQNTTAAKKTQSQAPSTTQAQQPPQQTYNATEQMDDDDDDEEEEAEDTCNFCGLRDASFLENEENLDLHYWQSCPMLTSCKSCEQVIEIATLHEHMLTECESSVQHELCQQCQVPYPTQQIQQHRAQCNENLDSTQLQKCPLCLANISVGEQGWKSHVLTYPGCKSNPRPLQ